MAINVISIIFARTAGGICYKAKVLYMCKLSTAYYTTDAAYSTAFAVLDW